MAVAPQQPQGGGSTQPRWRRVLGVVGRALGSYFVPELVPPPVRASVANIGVQGGTLYIDLVLGGLVGGGRKNVEIYVSGFNNPFTFDLDPRFLGDVANAIADYLRKNPGIAVSVVGRLTRSMGYEPTNLVSVEVKKQGDARVVSLVVSDNNGLQVEVPIILSPFNPRMSKVVIGTPVVLFPARQPLKDFMREVRVREEVARLGMSPQGGVAYTRGMLVIKPPGQAQPIIIQEGRAPLSTVLTQVGVSTPANLVSLLENALRTPLSGLRETVMRMLLHAGFSMPSVHEPIVVEASTANNDVTQFVLLFPVLFTNPSDQDRLENIVENRARPIGSDAIRLGYSIYSELHKQVRPERESGYFYRREVGYEASFVPIVLTINARDKTVTFQMPGVTPMSLALPAQEIANALAEFLTSGATEFSLPGATVRIIQAPQSTLQALGQLFQVQVPTPVTTPTARRGRRARAQHVGNISIAKFLNFGSLPTQLLIALNNTPITLTPGVPLKYSQYLGISRLADIDVSVLAIGDAVYEALTSGVSTQPLVNYLRGFVDALKNEADKAGVSVRELGLIGLALKHERGVAGKSYLVLLGIPVVVRQEQANALSSLIDSLSKSGNEFAKAVANYLSFMLKSNMVERAFRAHGLPMWKNAVLVPIAVGIRVTSTQAELLTPDKVLGVLADQNFDYVKSFVDFVALLEKKELKDWGILRSEASSRKPSAIPILTQDWISKYAR